MANADKLTTLAVQFPLLVAMHMQPSKLTAQAQSVALIALLFAAESRKIESHSSLGEKFLQCAGEALQWPQAALVLLRKQYGNSPTRGRSRRGHDEDDAAEKRIAVDVPLTSLTQPDTWDDIGGNLMPALLSSKTAWRTVVDTTIKWLNVSLSEALRLPQLRNVDYLADGFGFSPCERSIVSLAALVESAPCLGEFFSNYPTQGLANAYKTIAKVLGCRSDDVQRAMSSKSVLSRSGVLSLHHSTPRDFGDIFKLEEAYTKALLMPCASANELFTHFLNLAKPTTLSLHDFDYLGDKAELCSQLLSSAVASKTKGVNLLIYGAPGTGKTEFVRALAAHTQQPLYEVTTLHESDDKPCTSSQRLASLTLSHLALREATQGVLLFDEVEDVFPHQTESFFGMMTGKSRHDVSKAWMNQTLENNPVPTVWVSNAIGQMDEAYLRRFSLHIAFKHPPTSVRKRLAAQAFAPLGVSEPFINHIAALEQLAPAHLASAAKLAQLIAPGGAAATEALLRTQLNAARTAMQLPLHSQQRSSPVAYDPRFVRLQGNATAVDMLAALQRKGDTARAALCFWGQPGTGKTELAHHIAAVLGRELVVKTASDLLSMWLGEAEKNVAAMFNDAADRHSEVVLLLDEADSLLRDRAKASARYEGSITNEFLKQMEHYPGIFICTTNLFADLDPAVLRRFQFRLEFLALTAQQARELYVHSFEQSLSDEGILALAKAPDLVPADFANVKRQMQFMDSTYLEATVITQLAAEAKTRKGESAGERRGMGFV